MASNAGGELVIRLEGPFDLTSLGRLQQRLADVPRGERVLVDLSKVREIDDYVVAALAQSAAAGPGRVELRGLRQHQLRLMRYFGVASAAL